MRAVLWRSTCQRPNRLDATLGRRPSSLQRQRLVTLVFYRARTVLAFRSSKHAFWCAAAPPRPFWDPMPANAIPSAPPPPRPLWASTAPNAHPWWSTTLPRPFWTPSAHSGVLISCQGRAGFCSSKCPVCPVRHRAAEAILGLHSSKCALWCSASALPKPLHLLSLQNRSIMCHLYGFPSGIIR